MKKCKRCGEEKPLNEFHTDNNALDGKKSQCKLCRNIRKNEYLRLKRNLPLDYKFNLTRKTKNKPKSSHKYRSPMYGAPKLYQIWSDAKQRCFNSKRKDYHRYGGRGITMYEPWIKNSKIFIEYLKTLPGWDNSELSIDRIENNGNYQPGNLRFATAKEQANNRRNRK